MAPLFGVADLHVANSHTADSLCLCWNSQFLWSPYGIGQTFIIFCIVAEKYPNQMNTAGSCYRVIVLVMVSHIISLQICTPRCIDLHLHS